MADPTSRGYPRYDDDDDADIAFKLNAISEAVNADLEEVTADPAWANIANVNSGFKNNLAQYLRTRLGLTFRLSLERKQGVVTVGDPVFGVSGFEFSSTLYRLPFNGGNALGMLAVNAAGLWTVDTVIGQTQTITVAQTLVPLV